MPLLLIVFLDNSTERVRTETRSRQDSSQPRSLGLSSSLSLAPGDGKRRDLGTRLLRQLEYLFLLDVSVRVAASWLRKVPN